MSDHLPSEEETEAAAEEVVGELEDWLRDWYGETGDKSFKVLFDRYLHDAVPRGVADKLCLRNPESRTAIQESIEETSFEIRKDC